MSWPDFEEANKQLSDESYCFNPFSSILRISSPKTQIWNHYDTINNFLIQITGSKQIFLSPPKAASTIKLPINSDKPEFFDPWQAEIDGNFNDQKNLIYKDTLQPSEILFLPSHWFHATKVVDNTGSSISINYFWQQKSDPNKTFYDRKDLYGNKASKPAQEIEKLGVKINELLKEMPNEQIRDFYKEQVIGLIEGRAYF